MFCRYCGQKIHNDSLFCSFCGKKLKIETQDEASKRDAENRDSPESSVFQSDPEFVWDINEFSKREEAGQEFYAPHEALDPLLANEILREGEPAPPADRGGQSETEKGITLEDIKRELRITGSEQGEGGRFNTFHQKNEEFQKLLDKEYERTKNKELSLESGKAEASGEQAPPESAEAGPETPAGESGRDDSGENIIFDNETLLKRFDTKEFNADLIEFALERAGIKVSKDGPEVAKIMEGLSGGRRVASAEARPKPETPAGQGVAGEKYESGFKPRFIADSEHGPSESGRGAHGERADGLEARALPDSPWAGLEADEKTLPENTYVGLERVTIEGLPAIDPQKQQAFKELERMWEEGTKGGEEQMEAFSGRPVREGDGQSESPRKRGVAAKAIIAALIVLIAVHVSVLGIIHVAPESRAAAFINRELGFAVTWFSGLFSGNSQEEDAEGEVSEVVTHHGFDAGPASWERRSYVN